MGKLGLTSESNTPNTPADGCVLFADNSNPPRLRFVDEAGNAFYFLFTSSAPATALLSNGTWTPVLTIGGATTGIVSTVSGTYYRVGNLVYVEGSVTLTSKGSLTGALEISGLPVAAKSQTLPAAQPRYVANLASISGQLLMPISLQKITLAQVASNTYAALTDANLTNTSQIVLSGVYTVA